jgi:PKD repeat protein
MKSKNCILLILYIFVVFYVGCKDITTDEIALVPEFMIEPGFEVAVGEEVFFDATNGSFFPDSTAFKYEWDFGDGYGFKQGFPLYASQDSGISCTHFYTAPGEYAVTLTVIRLNNSTAEKARIIKKIKVTGFPRTFKFELLHANFHTRIGQYIYIRTTETARDATRATVVLIGDSGYSQDFGSFSVFPGQETRFLLKNAELPQGQYTLLARLYGAGDMVLDEIREKFIKPYTGMPRVGINEHNALCVDGKPYFPIAAWLLNPSAIGTWKDKYINTLNGVGYYPENSLSTWSNYLGQAQIHSLKVIGPERWQGKGEKNYYRNSDINRLKEYVLGSKDKPSLFMYHWLDEPNMGGTINYTPAQVFRSWVYQSHKLDPHHPVFTNFYGFDYLPYYDNVNHTADRYFNLLTNDKIFGLKTCISDVISFDIYPLEYRDHPSLEGMVSGKEFELYIGAIERIQARNHHLIPFINFVETQDIRASRNTPGPTPAQLEMEIWLSIVHGAKGISWFHYFEPTPADNYAVMEKFKGQMATLQSIILSPEPVRKLTDNSDVKGKRVDTLIRETTEAVWVFAVRITELNETLPITVVFNISELSSGTVEVFDEGRNRPLSGGSFQDTFELCGVHIYKIQK